jgi:hypothetical protein
MRRREFILALGGGVVWPLTRSSSYATPDLTEIVVIYVYMFGVGVAAGPFAWRFVAADHRIPRSSIPCSGVGRRPAGRRYGFLFSQPTASSRLFVRLPLCRHCNARDDRSPRSGRRATAELERALEQALSRHHPRRLIGTKT